MHIMDELPEELSLLIWDFDGRWRQILNKCFDIIDFRCNETHEYTYTQNSIYDQIYLADCFFYREELKLRCIYYNKQLNNNLIRSVNFTDAFGSYKISKTFKKCIIINNERYVSENSFYHFMINNCNFKQSILLHSKEYNKIKPRCGIYIKQ